MKLSIGKVALVCGAVLIVLVLMNVFIASMPSPGELGGMVADALGRSDMSQTSVQVCVGFLNVGSCRSTQTQNDWRAPASGGSGFSSMPILLILAAGFLSVVFLGWIGLWLSGNDGAAR